MFVMRHAIFRLPVSAPSSELFDSLQEAHGDLDLALQYTINKYEQAARRLTVLKAAITSYPEFVAGTAELEISAGSLGEIRMDAPDGFVEALVKADLATYADPEPNPR
jgi:hypothetical protein